MPASLFSHIPLESPGPRGTLNFSTLIFDRFMMQFLIEFWRLWDPILDHAGSFFPLFLLLFSGIDFELIFQRFRCHFPTPESRKITFLLQTCRKIQGFAGTKKSSVFHRCLCNFRTRFWIIFSINSSLSLHNCRHHCLIDFLTYFGTPRGSKLTPK